MFNNLIRRFFALAEACDVDTSVKNTGGGCDKMLGTSKMLFAAPKGVVIPANTTDIVAWVKEQIHAAPSARVYPFFGYAKPLWNVVYNDSADVNETSEYTGEIAFIRAGVSNRVYETTHGGLCLAKALVSFRNSGYDFFEVDGDGIYALVKNSDGTYSFITALNMGGQSPSFASGTTQYKNRFGISFDPTNYINATVFDGGEGLLSLKGLEDVDVYVDVDSTPSTETTIYVKVKTECGSQSLVSLLGSAIAVVAAWSVVDDTGTPHVPSAAAILGDEVVLTGTFPAGDYVVSLKDPSVLYDNDIVYYEGKTSAEVETS